MILALISIGTLVLHSALPGQPTLQAQAETLVNETNGSWGVVARSLDTGRELISIEPSTIFVPASNNKIFTAIWALDELGSQHRFATDLLIQGNVANGHLQGDVIIRGSGDPAFGYPTNLNRGMFVEDPLKPFRAMAARLAQLGIKSVGGSVVADATVFDTQLVGPNWPNDTGGGAAQYAPRVSGLAFQRNMVWVVAERRGGNITVSLDPRVESVPLVSRMGAGRGRALVTRKPNEDTIRVTGNISGNGSIRWGIGVANPALLAADAFRLALAEVGIQVMGGVRLGEGSRSARVVHRHISIPVSQMIPLLNQQSDNFFAEQLWKATVHAVIGEGSYERGGPVGAAHFIRRAGIRPGELFQFDGSGLSSYNRASPRAIVQVLAYAHAQPYSNLWHRSLAVAGDRNGTMDRLYRNTAAEGNLHAKTGFIRGVRTLSGYVRARNGQMIAFSFLYNGPNTTAARGIQEDLGVLLAEYDGS